MLSFLINYGAVNGGIAQQHSWCPRNRGDGVLPGMCAGSSPLKFQDRFSDDMMTSGGIGEIAVPGAVAGHTHYSWPLRNRSDGYFKQLRADPDRDISRDGTASCPPYLHSARDLETRGDGE